MRVGVLGPYRTFFLKRVRDIGPSLVETLQNSGAGAGAGDGDGDGDSDGDGDGDGAKVVSA